MLPSTFPTSRSYIAALICIVSGADQSWADSGVRILAFGDSNTWGLMPLNNPPQRHRYGSEVRWTEILRRELGGGAVVIENGLIGRTVDQDEPTGLGGNALSAADFNGGKHLAEAVAVNAPIDVVLIVLGTNDVATKYGRSGSDIAKALVRLAAIPVSVNGQWTPLFKPPTVLVVAPPPVGGTFSLPIFEQWWKTAPSRLSDLKEALRASPLPPGVAIDALDGVVLPVGADGVHLTAEGHRNLGRHLAGAVRKQLEPGSPR
jgi:lysophospholipase L1-like esterase